MDAQGQIQTGMTVYGSDGEKVGTVVGFDGRYVVVEKGFFFPADHYIPVSAIASVGEDEAYLSVTKDQAVDQGWDRQPEGWVSADAAGVDRGSAEADDRAAAAGDVATGDEALRVPVYEEDIQAVKRDVDRGAVRVEKELVTEDRTVTVPVTEERVRVTRVDSNDPGAVGADAFEEGVIEVPVRGQEVDVEKTARMAGEVIVEKEAVTRSEQVGGTVRREEVRVDDQSVETVVEDSAGTARDPRNRASRSERRRSG
jgi:uncharacterized protein (TIGR02271 family)